MSSGAYLHLGGLLVDETRNDINPAAMMLFRETERESLDTTVSHYHSDIKAGSEDDFPLQTLTYRIPVNVLRDRLDLLGFSLSLAKERFTSRVGKAIEAHNDLIRAWFSDDVVAEPLFDVPTNLSPEDWLSALKKIRDESLFLRVEHPVVTGVPPIIQFMLRDRFSCFGFPDYDVRLGLRLMLEAFDDDEHLEYDLTELLAGGWVDSHADLVETAEYLISEDFAESRRIVVLTEGKTDKEFLERSLRLRYPHLADYFAFMDFEGARIEGGAGPLANIVKAFVGAGILNRILALFDNDAAGRLALESLARLTLPDNIVAQTFPPLKIAEAYPTLGPTGVANLDVNGLAGSIELYLGEDILTFPNGEFAPVQWRGFNERLNCYQGQITHKELLHERFRAKLTACEEDPKRLNEFDWTGIEQILLGMRSAFHGAAAKAYRAEAQQLDG